MCNMVIIHLVYKQYLGFSHFCKDLFLKYFVLLIFWMDAAAGTLLFPHCGILKFYLFFRFFLCFSIFILFFSCLCQCLVLPRVLVLLPSFVLCLIVSIPLCVKAVSFFPSVPDLISVCVFQPCVCSDFGRSRQ